MGYPTVETACAVIGFDAYQRVTDRWKNRPPVALAYLSATKTLWFKISERSSNKI